MIKRPKDQQRQTGSSGILPKQWDKEPQQDGQSSAPRTELASPPPAPPQGPGTTSYCAQCPWQSRPNASSSGSLCVKLGHNGM